MTSKLKCPFCLSDLESTTGGWEYGCTNTECQSAGTLCGTKELWQELIRTRKALDVALKCLNGVGKELPWVKRALEEITALEQKSNN